MHGAANRADPLYAVMQYTNLTFNRLCGEQSDDDDDARRCSGRCTSNTPTQPTLA